MNKAIGLALLAVGILPDCVGNQLFQFSGLDFSRFFTGSPTNKSMCADWWHCQHMVAWCSVCVRHVKCHRHHSPHPLKNMLETIAFFDSPLASWLVSSYTMVGLFIFSL